MEDMDSELEKRIIEGQAVDREVKNIVDKASLEYKKSALNALINAFANPAANDQTFCEMPGSQMESNQAPQKPQHNQYVAPIKSEYDISHPERAGIASREKVEDKRRKYAEEVANLPNNEIENLKALIDHDGRFVIDAKALVAMGKATGKGIETDNLEKLGIIKRVPIYSIGGNSVEMVEFLITEQGKKIYSALSGYYENKLSKSRDKS
jgi:hypothetical protein